MVWLAESAGTHARRNRELPNMANETVKPKRVVKRLTTAEKRDKAIAEIGDQLNKAGSAIVRAAEGMVACGRRGDAKRCLDLWGEIIELATPEPDEPLDAAITP